MGVKKRTHKDARVLLSLVERWRERGELTPLERDLALDKLSAIYENILLDSTDQGDAIEQELFDLNIDELLKVSGNDSEGDDESDESEGDEPDENEPEIEVEVVLFDDDSQEEVVEHSYSSDDSSESEEPEVEVEVLFFEDEQPEQPEQDASEEPDEEESVPAEVEDVAEVEELLTPKVKSKRRAAILSLYDDEDETVELSVEQQEVAQQEAEKVELVEVEKDNSAKEEPSSASELEIIAERLSKGVESLSDRLKAEEQTTIADTLSTLSGSLSLNDKYEIANELFDGEQEELVKLLNHIDGVDSFDECVIYISENYNFSSDSRAAQMLLSLFEQKFSRRG